MTLTTERAPGREHIPRYTRGFIAIRILQFILAIICLGLMAYTIALLAFSGNCLMLFTVRLTAQIPPFHTKPTNSLFPSVHRHRGRDALHDCHHVLRPQELQLLGRAGA